MGRQARWWDGKANERYWLESTDREDLGSDLRAPLADEAGRDNWRYTLFREASVGDLVFHYDKRHSAITAVSRVAGPAAGAPIIWVARGSYARERRATPTEVPGYRVPLTDYRLLEQPLSLDALRTARPLIQSIIDTLAASKRSPLYFPFELSKRPVRPLQGYAFKLPADFVAAFSPLHAGAGIKIEEPDMPSQLDDVALFRAAVAAIEDAVPAYAVADVQRFRARAKGLQRVAKSLFRREAKADEWTFHRGGREELQFNLGLDYRRDGRRVFRAGIAFSFETSRSFPDIEILIPKVARFNAWMREHPETLSDLTMWHWEGNERSIDYSPGPIPANLIHNNTFVFVGGQQAVSAIDPHVALRTLDRLFDLYKWVEGGAAANPDSVTNIASAQIDLLHLDSGREIDGGRWIAATIRERTLDIYLRHAEMQLRLKAELLSEGCKEVIFEAPIGQRAVDVVARHADGLWFYEVKTCASVRGCLREAIGQLLEYALWPGATRPKRIIVVGQPSLDANAVAYLKALNKSFPVPIDYRQLTLDC